MHPHLGADGMCAVVKMWCGHLYQHALLLQVVPRKESSMDSGGSADKVGLDESSHRRACLCSKA